MNTTASDKKNTPHLSIISQFIKKVKGLAQKTASLRNSKKTEKPKCIKTLTTGEKMNYAIKPKKTSKNPKKIRQKHTAPQSNRHLTLNIDKSPLPTERGVASMYVVIFATLIFGIITLSFVRIILSEAQQTTNADLSRSAYDSALAGIEDGKVAVLRYHECLSQGYTSGKDGPDTCNRVIYYMEEGIKNESCDAVRQTLAASRGEGNIDNSTGEVTIQERSGSAAKDLQQAYTCVKIADDLQDYRSTLSSRNRTRVIPLRTMDSDIDSFNRIRLQWYSPTNQAQQDTSTWFKSIGSVENLDFTFTNASIAPSPIAITFIQTDKNFHLNELSVSNNVGTDISRLTLVPSTATDSKNSGSMPITANDIMNGANKSANSPTKVSCYSNANFSEDFACSVDILIPKTFQGSYDQNVGSMFLIVSLLYGEPITDFSVSLCKTIRCTGDNIAHFSGAQTSIDSTGRANDLYRRVETRIELYDVSFPYPEFELQNGSSESGINIYKNFYITKNCWWSNSRSLSGSSSSDSLGSTCDQNNNTKGNNN